MSPMVRVKIMNGDTPVEMDIPVHRLYNLGSATRVAEEARAHQDEMAGSGIAIAFDVPAPRVYPIAAEALTTSTDVGVHGPHTSGEAEIVAVRHDGELYVGVGSDHTDRDLERTSILWSKQVCPDILAPELWPWPEVSDHWDDCTLELDVDGEPYQRLPAGMFLLPGDLLMAVQDRTQAPESGLWVFGGTGATIGRRLAFGHSWVLRLSDPRLRRTIEHGYQVTNLLDEVRQAYRVPLRWPE